MEVSKLLNPPQAARQCSSQQYRTRKPMDIVTDMLEQIYIHQAYPSAELLQSLMKMYPAIPSLVYLRSWFNNRHNKHRRQINLIKTDKVQQLRKQCVPIIVLLNGDSIDLTRQVSNALNFYPMIKKLKRLQDLYSDYMEIIQRFDGK